MPNGTELHVGFFAPQSKHIWPTVSPWGVKWGAEQGGTYFVGRLGFELGEDVLRLCLGGEGHGESEAAAMGTPDEDGVGVGGVVGIFWPPSGMPSWPFGTHVLALRVVPGLEQCRTI
jgi:hypothetical protein